MHNKLIRKGLSGFNFGQMMQGMGGSGGGSTGGAGGGMNYGALIQGAGQQISVITNFITNKRRKKIYDRLNRRANNQAKFSLMGYNLQGSLTEDAELSKKLKNLESWDLLAKANEKAAMQIGSSLGGNGKTIHPENQLQQNNLQSLLNPTMSMPVLTNPSKPLITSTNANMPTNLAGIATQLGQNQNSLYGILLQLGLVNLLNLHFKSGGKLNKFQSGGGFDFSKIAGAMGNSKGGGMNFSSLGGMDLASMQMDMANAMGASEEEGEYGDLNKSLNDSYDIAQNVVSQMGPYGKIIGGVMAGAKLTGRAMKKVGGGTDGMTRKDAVINSDWLQMTPIGLINGFGGKKSNTLNDLTDLTNFLYGQNSMSGFSGTLDAVDNTMKYSNKKYGLFSSKERKKVNKVIDKLNMQQNQIQDIANASRNQFEVQASMADVQANATGLDLNGGYQQSAVHVGKEGMKIDYSSVFDNKNKYSVVFAQKGTKLELFKEGGQMNVIPEGNLHARLHHMEDADSLTKKGIPVVDNNGEQQAEIELNEIIFNKEVTTKLEELWKIYKDDDTSTKKKEKCCILAGKLLAKEILENTDDRTGLIDTI